MTSQSYTDAYWWRVENHSVRCLLCPHACLLGEGETGICRTRQHVNKKLVTTAYGNLCAVNIDPIEKKPLFHFHPGTSTFSVATNGCNLRCLNCQNHTISQSPPDGLNAVWLTSAELVAAAKNQNCTSISYTYTDPVAFYEYMLDTARIARNAGLANIFVSSGYINSRPLKELCQVIDAANIDLKCFDDDIYHRLCGASLRPVLKALQTIKEAGVWLEITNLIIPGWTDNIEMIEKMCSWLADNGFEESPIHFSRFFPSHKLNHLSPTPVETIEKAAIIAIRSGLKYVYTGNMPGSDLEKTRCHNCNTNLIIRRGNILMENHLRTNTCPVCETIIPGIFD